MKRYKAIVYDLDGTLINTLDMNMYPLMRIIEEELGESWTYDQVLRFSAQPGLKTMDDLGIQDKDTVYARWVRYVNEYPHGAIVFDGIRKVLEAVRAAGIRQAVVSSKMHKQYQIDIVDNGLDEYLETAVLAEDTVLHKPHPEPIWECLKRMDLKPEEILYVGDAHSDLLAANAAGVDSGFAGWGAVSEDGMETATYRFAHPEDMLTLL